MGNESPEASITGEIVPGNDFYDYNAKYIDDNSDLLIPARISPATQEAVRELGIRAFQAVEAWGLARVDFFVRESDEAIFINEINTMPGFTPISMYPKLWEASGRELWSVDRPLGPVGNRAARGQAEDQDGAVSSMKKAHWEKGNVSNLISLVLLIAGLWGRVEGSMAANGYWRLDCSALPAARPTGWP